MEGLSFSLFAWCLALDGDFESLFRPPWFDRDELARDWVAEDGESPDRFECLTGMREVGVSLRNVDFVLGDDDGLRIGMFEVLRFGMLGG